MGKCIFWTSLPFLAQPTVPIVLQPAVLIITNPSAISTHLPIHSPAHLSIHPFIHSFIHPFIQQDDCCSPLLSLKYHLLEPFQNGGRDITSRHLAASRDLWSHVTSGRVLYFRSNDTRQAWRVKTKEEHHSPNNVAHPEHLCCIVTYLPTWEAC